MDINTETDIKFLGEIISIRGQVVEVEFSRRKPAIHDLLVLADNNESKLEVFSSSGPNTFYCLALTSTNEMYRGAKVINKQTQILFPVGQGVLGRVLDIFGDSLDGKGEVKSSDKMPIHGFINRKAELIQNRNYWKPASKYWICSLQF